LNKGYLFDGYEKEKFHKAIDVRTKRLLSGMIFPEKAMFFKFPMKMLYGVYIRHHSFKVRNDDVANHLIGYCNFLNYSSKVLATSDRG